MGENTSKKGEEVFMSSVPRLLRNFLELMTGYPANPELAYEYIWAWRFTGIRPHRLEMTEIGQKPAFRFKRGPVTYFCSPDPEGKYVIGNVDTDGFFNNDRYMRRAYLVAHFLGKRPSDCSKEEAVSFCARAVCIERDHGQAVIDTSKIMSEEIQHAIISLC